MANAETCENVPNASSVSKKNKEWNMNYFLQNTPCVRSSLMLGISTGATAGLVMFIYSKHVKKSCDVAVGSFLAGSIMSWSYCSYHRYQQLKNVETIVKALEEKNKITSLRNEKENGG